MKTNVLTNCNMPQELVTILSEAGWRPEVNRRSSVSVYRGQHFASVVLRKLGVMPPIETNDPFYVDTKFNIWDDAAYVLDQLFGLTIRSQVSVGPFVNQTIVFDPQICRGFEAEVHTLELILKTPIVPIGEVLSSSILLLCRSGHLLQLGYVAPGVALSADNLPDGLLRILQGEHAATLVFNQVQDPDHHFAYVDYLDIEREMRSALAVGSGGIWDLSSVGGPNSSSTWR